LASELAKTALSASSQAPIEVESLYQGMDFFADIKRAHFNMVVSSVLRKSLAVVDAALADAGIDDDAIDIVVPVGGGCLIPRVLMGLQVRLLLSPFVLFRSAFSLRVVFSFRVVRVCSCPLICFGEP
jgi:molecular chaperone DnaK (HSP70)